jgi:hypothetical protein
MRQTTEQRAAHITLAALAKGYRVVKDLEGWPVVPGKYGRLEHDGHALTAYTDRPRLHARLLATPGVVRHQRGDTELRVVLAEGAVPAVARLFRSSRRRTLSTTQAHNLGVNTAYRATSAAAGA